MLKLGVSEKYLKYLQVILGSLILILILVLGLFGNTDTVLKYIFSSTCPSVVACFPFLAVTVCLFLYNFKHLVFQCIMLSRVLIVVLLTFYFMIFDI